MDNLCHTLIGGLHMTLYVNFSPEMEGFIKSKVASGFYGNATEVIRDAVRRMHTPQALNDITQSAINTLHSGAPIDADALP